MRISYSVKAILLSGLFLVACSFHDDKTSAVQSGGDPSPASQRGLVAFQGSVYAYARQNCVACHAHNQNPMFAQDDIGTAYKLARNYVRFDRIPDSTFVVRTKNGHCGAPCMTDGTAMIAAIQSWWDNGEKQDEPPPPPPSSNAKQTEAIAVDADLALQAHQTVQWKLDSLGSDFAGVVLQMDLQRFDATTYRLSLPRLTTAAQAIHLKGIQVQINGESDPANTDYAALEDTVRAHSSPVLSSFGMIVAQDKGPGADRISLLLTDIEAVAAPGCHNSMAFSQLVAPVMTRSCDRCHSGTSDPDAKAAFDMSADAATVCQEARERLDFEWPDRSALIDYPLFQTNGHPVRDLSEKDEAAFLQWAQAEGNG
jgi:hypothetical protein